ncbi:MAG: hypothetical protein SCH71_15465 [Desulfobulbaceae bacterium]|nr:hypothetical protein [Desulfobulbaceae bacterium]
MAEKKRLGELIVEANLITEADLNKALRLQVGGIRRLGYILIKMGLISEEQLQTVLSRQLDLPLVRVENEFNPEVKNILPGYLCRKYSVIPLNTGENNTLKMAMVDPSDREAVSDIENYTGKVVQPVLASKSDISANIRSRIPWSPREIFNPQTFSRWTAVISVLAIILIIITAVQFYQYRQQVRYGKVTQSAQSITYENHELLLGFDDQNKVSLLGRGAHASGYYSVTFNNTESLRSFLAVKKDDFSTEQLEWLTWAMNNPRSK